MITGCVGFTLNISSASILRGLCWPSWQDVAKSLILSCQNTIMRSKQPLAFRQVRTWIFSLYARRQQAVAKCKGEA
jgi:hypothetical protein